VDSCRGVILWTAVEASCCGQLQRRLSIFRYPIYEKRCSKYWCVIKFSGDIKKILERELWDVCRRYIAGST
jgi:hypothetical protein